MASGPAGAGTLTLVEAMLLFAILVVVPLSVPLHPVAGRSHAATAFLAGAPAAPAMLLEPAAVS